MAHDVLTFSEVVRCIKGKQARGGWYNGHCLCPNHKNGDANPSLGVIEHSDGFIGFNSFAGCDHKAIISAIEAATGKKLTKWRGEAGKQETAEPKEKKPKPSELPSWSGFTLAEYCALKRFFPETLTQLLDAREVTYNGKTVIGWSYYDETGTKLLARKLRLSHDSHDTCFQPANPHVPYGLNNPLLRMIPPGAKYDLIIAEGETDEHTFTMFGLPAVGISGATGWLPEYAEIPVIDKAARIFIAEHQDESDNGGKAFSAKILKTLPQALILRPPDGSKDFGELYLKYADFRDTTKQHPFLQNIDIAIQAATLEKAMRKPKRAKPKPAPMSDAAFYGLAGKIVKKLEPELETDRNAILSNVLACAAVLFQREAYFKVLANLHYPNDYFQTVGNSSVSRKGTTTDVVLEIMEEVCPGFKDRIMGGLSTGQGLIGALIKKRADDDEDSEALPEPIAPAVLIEITEFAELLAVMKREENTLSAVLRAAWDGKPLAVLTRKDPLKVKNVSLSTVAHITRAELLNKLTSVDRANGFANRFLFVWSERTKLLSSGKLSRIELTDVVAELRAAVKAAQGVGEIERDTETELLWAEEYKRLTTRGDTMTDVLLSRAEAHVVRLSLLYALLDSSKVVRKEHLQAALAFWDYCEASVQYVFGDVGDQDAKKILRKLEDGPLTEGDIRRTVFGDNKPAGWVADKMLELEQLRKVRRTTKEFKTKVVAAWSLVESEPG
jgi:hypothetical protein